MDDTELKLADLRLRLAWDYFAFHAKQRISVFNFFIIGVGVLANACVALVIAERPDIAGLLCFFASAVCLVFLGLDVRNHKLVKFGERALEMVEINVLASEASGAKFELLTSEARDAMAMGAFMRLTKHKYLIRGLQVVFAAGFLVAGFLGVSSLTIQQLLFWIP